MVLRKAMLAVAAVTSLAFLLPTEASAGGGFGRFNGGGFHGGFGPRGRVLVGPVIVGAGIGLGLAGSSWDSGYGWGNPCVQPRQVWTDWGWRIAPVNVC
jgi:hypothetical protein